MSTILPGTNERVFLNQRLIERTDASPLEIPDPPWIRQRPPERTRKRLLVAGTFDNSSKPFQESYWGLAELTNFSLDRPINYFRLDLSVQDGPIRFIEAHKGSPKR
jgi:hypothetical protein